MMVMMMMMLMMTIIVCMMLDLAMSLDGFLYHLITFPFCLQALVDSIANQSPKVRFFSH